MADVDASVGNEWQTVLDDSNENTFLVAGYEGNTIKVQATGSTGLAGLKAALKDDEVQFGGFRCNAVDNVEASGAKSTRAKFIFVQWIGENVGGLKKAKAGFAKSAVEPSFQGTHVSVSASTADDLVEDEITATIISNSGAHKPTAVEY